jgi:hypothetical protein
MKLFPAGLAAAATLAVASPVMAQNCLVPSRVDNFGSVNLGTRVTEIPAGLAIAEQ